MYISEIIIDGFKSYAQRTVVSGFDPQFNAITGLNGSGKSNILDSICFVLGISNLTQVRVGNLQELVYKQGQAGVTKASVTIVFDNSDPATSPIGYETQKQITVTRQVIIGGKNKYIINGHTVQQSQVQNMFHSVQLNVNNPHFLIMQGRITKVLNMKPPEILSMIEEAAGTRMFETKKQAALKTIEKKQLKVEELTKCMEEEIIPTLENLRNERQSYMTWQSNNSEVERLERLCVAYEYKAAEDKVKGAEDERKAMEIELQSMDDSHKAKLAECESFLERIKTLETNCERETQGELQDLKKREADLSKELVKLNTLLNNQKEAMGGEKDAIASLKKQHATATKALADKRNEAANFKKVVTAKEEEANQCDRNASQLREKYQNAVAGVADDSNTETLSLPEQVANWERKAREAQSHAQQVTLKVDHAKNTLKDLRKAAGTQQAGYQDAAKESESLSQVIKKLEAELASIQTQSREEDEASLRRRAQELKSSMTGLKDVIDNLTANLEARLNFEFRDPERGFDRSKVKGLVARLVRVSDTRASTALEIAAGAKLYQVVVDSEQTGKLLLEKGQLRKRVTILPLNKLTSKCVEPAKVDRAKSIAQSMGGHAHLALELVGYDEEVRRAMEYVFGNVIICENSEIAKAIAFDKAIRNRTVTLDGDSYDPAGTLTGGSKNQIGVLLSKIEELASAQNEYNAKEAEYRQIVSSLGRAETIGNRSRDIAAELDIKKHALGLCQDRLKNTTYAQTMAQITQIETDLQTYTNESAAMQEQYRHANEELKRLKAAESNVKKQREKAMKDLENQMKQAAKQASTSKAELTALKVQQDSLEAEIASLQAEIESLEEQIRSSESSSKKAGLEFEALEREVATLRQRYEDAKNAVVQKQEAMATAAKEIKHLKSGHERAQKDAQNISLEARKVQHRLKQWEKDLKDAQKVLQNLMKEHSWISKEMAYFGVPGSDFDFAGRDLQQCTKRLKEIKSDQDKLSKKINKKVMGMIEKAENEYEDLRKKRDVIVKDKQKIESVIEELDVKKLQALQSTWIKVNRDFGSIFSMLLPGTHAKLEPPEGCSVSDGLEVKVAFNGVWKESLTELSGGQRSLLALSLILALLLFKPAPMYILDEVDAALDLSHTQNIGLMLRTHFSNSQFIVVSLKEGMFNNANVIFRTKFVDGVSTVTRTVAGSRAANKNAQQEEAAAGALLLTNEDAEPSRKKSKNVGTKGKKTSEAMEI